MFDSACSAEEIPVTQLCLRKWRFQYETTVSQLTYIWFFPSLILHNKITPGIPSREWLRCMVLVALLSLAPHYKQQNYLGQSTLSGARTQAWTKEMEGGLHQLRMYILLCPVPLSLQHLLFFSVVCPDTEQLILLRPTTIFMLFVFQKDRGGFFWSKLLSKGNIFSGDCFLSNFIWEHRWLAPISRY